MVKIILILSVCYTPIASFFIGNLIGPGKWSVVHFKQCPNADQYLFQLDVARRKLNRTHDCYSGELKIAKDLTQSYGSRTDVCKHLDGGCKRYNSLADASFCNFVWKYARENTESVCQAIGISLPMCPVAAGTYELKDYIFDYSKLHGWNEYGMYNVRSFVLDVLGTTVGCLDITVRFEKDDADEDDDDEDDE